MRVAVSADGTENQERAAELAERLGLEIARPGEAGVDLFLTVAPRGLELREAGTDSGPLAVEFSADRGSRQLRRATLAGSVGNRIIDATAGLGQDAFALAEWGSEVELVERSPLIAVLLADALGRARREPATRQAAERMSLHTGDAFELLPRLPPAEVVYLDPMYPRSGREGRKAKGMRILRELLGDDGDADALLLLARRVAGRRVVVKRPLRAPPLAAQKPSGSLAGISVRYDLYSPLAGSDNSVADSSAADSS